MILPCPFCGETPDIRNPDVFQTSVCNKWGYVVCCCHGPDIRTNYEAVEDWKDRAIAEWNIRRYKGPQ